MHYGLRLPLAHLLQAVTTLRVGFKEGANWAVAQGPPQLRGLHKKAVKIITYKET